MSLCIETFPEYCVVAPEWGCSGRDRLGVQTGVAFNNALYAASQGDPTRFSASLRGPSDLLATTLDAALLDLLLKTNPFVWEIRCHYPLCVRGRAEPLIIERMVTVERRGLPGVQHLHAVMCSHTDFQKFKKHLDREGVSSEIFDASSISPLQIQNASFSYGVARRMNIREPKTRECAARLAQRIYESDRRSVRRRALGADRKYRECTLDGLLTRLARREE
ncbi:hypothetical protein [Cupriavidus basilensis]